LAQAGGASLRFELARALGSLLLAREQALVRLAGAPRRGAAAAFTASFASALLVPPRGLRERWAAAAPGRGGDDSLALAHVARLYGVSKAVLRARLHSLRLWSGGSGRDPADVAALEYHGDAPDAGAEGPWDALPDRYVFLALRAHSKGLIETPHLAECLRVDEREARLLGEAYTRGA
jgi:Zn-dependent peptidase ImmA (M78 family)